MKRLFTANEVLAFVVELVALGVLGYWGLKAGGVVLAAALPVAAAVLWGLFAAPRARYKVPLAVQLAVKVVVFGASIVGLLATGHPVLGTVFAVLVLVNTVAATIWRARGFEFGADHPDPARR
jgi:hypothetical protein